MLYNYNQIKAPVQSITLYLRFLFKFNIPITLRNKLSWMLYSIKKFSTLALQVIFYFNFFLAISYPFQFSSVQWLSHVRLFGTPWTATCQASMSITTSRGLLKLMSIESVMPSNHLILCRPLLLLSIMVLSNWSVFVSGGQSIGVSASISVLPMNIQDWFTLGWTGWTSLMSKGLSRVFSNTTVQKHQFFGSQLSL